jgi:hypothetical protein
MVFWNFFGGRKRCPEHSFLAFYGFLLLNPYARVRARHHREDGYDGRLYPIPTRACARGITAQARDRGDGLDEDSE